MSKLRTDSIDPRLASNVDFGGLDVPSWQGIPFVLPDSPAFTGTPTAPTAADSTNSSVLATTAYVTTRAANEVTNRLATAAPLMDGNTATVGVATKAAREDHVHPHDSSIAALGTSIQASLGGSFFFNSPGTYTNFFTAPATGTVYYIVVGGGGGGGGGGADLSGLPGGPGTVNAGSIAMAAGDVVTAVVGGGGAGSPAGVNPFSISAPSAGQSSSLSFVSGTTIPSAGGSAGSVVSQSTISSSFVDYTYFCADTGDFALIKIAQDALAASTPSSVKGLRALSGIGTSIGVSGLAANPTAINGRDGKVGGGGGGGAPSKAFVTSRGIYIDPVAGEGGDGTPTASGGDGGVGMVYFEYQAAGQPRAVSAGTLQLLRAELQNQGVTLSFHPTVN